MSFFDPRMEQVRKIVEALVTKRMFEYTKVLIRNDNTLVIVLDQTLLFQVPLKSTDVLPSVAFIYRDVFEFEDLNMCISDNVLVEEITNLVNIYNSIAIPQNLIAEDNQLRDNEEFANLLELGSSEGLKFFKMVGLDPNKIYMIPMFSGFISLNNNDNIGLSLYNINQSFLLIRMNIFKKKINRNITVDCKIINI